MAHDTKTWRCGKYEIKFDRPRIMGVLNVTPDSFSDGDESNLDVDSAVARGVAMLDAGADIIDVGGESTRPGFTPVSADEEAKRVLPVIRALAQRGAIVSIDTRHVEVAKAAVRVGASIVNDVTGFTDPKMIEFVKSTKCGVVIAHAGEVTEPARAHKAVQLDTSAAAFVAEKARAAAAAAAAGATANKKRGRGMGGSRLIGGLVQPQLPFADIPNGSAAVAGDTPAAEPAAPAAEETAPAEAVAAQLTGASIEADAVKTAPDGAAAETSEPEDKLAAVMARASRREEAYVSTSQLRRFTLPDSAPIMRRVMGFLSDQARALIHAGVARERICIDPGAGFGKNTNEDIIIQRETAKMASLGYPLMCAVSRKRFVGAVSGVVEAADRDAATFGVCLGAIQAGANVVRVHDVAGFAQFLNGYWAVARPQPRRAFVALGSNLGRRMDNIRAAKDLIAEIPLTCVSNCSRIYESEPAYEERQEPFANAVIEIRTELAPLILLDELMKVEDKLGRNRTASAKPNGPRTLDCDLLWMEGEIHGGDKLRLPHPKLGERDFVLVPLEDLVHDPARFFRYEGVDVKEPEERVGHVTQELGTL
ncbi:2-amino-4-hydroxy-6-hydroxymethyldihydropteridine diphosphokinase [Collinsella tanakaei]|nr:2-amino-4-hydroxy-6-hydroxymethyldihydropteridine diphosphokinase [Collinsella tanakaei]